MKMEENDADLLGLLGYSNPVPLSSVDNDPFSADANAGETNKNNRSKAQAAGDTRPTERLPAPTKSRTAGHGHDDEEVLVNVVKMANSGENKGINKSRNGSSRSRSRGRKSPVARLLTGRSSSSAAANFLDGNAREEQQQRQYQHHGDKMRRPSSSSSMKNQRQQHPIGQRPSRRASRQGGGQKMYQGRMNNRPQYDDDEDELGGGGSQPSSLWGQPSPPQPQKVTQTNNVEDLWRHSFLPLQAVASPQPPPADTPPVRQQQSQTRRNSHHHSYQPKKAASQQKKKQEEQPHNHRQIGKPAPWAEIKHQIRRKSKDGAEQIRRSLRRRSSSLRSSTSSQDGNSKETKRKEESCRPSLGLGTRTQSYNVISSSMDRRRMSKSMMTQDNNDSLNESNHSAPMNNESNHSAPISVNTKPDEFGPRRKSYDAMLAIDNNLEKPNTRSGQGRKKSQEILQQQQKLSRSRSEGNKLDVSTESSESHHQATARKVPSSKPHPGSSGTTNHHGTNPFPDNAYQSQIDAMNKQMENQRRIAQSKSLNDFSKAMSEGTVEKLLDNGNEDSETYQAVIKATTTSSKPPLVAVGPKSNDANPSIGNTHQNHINAMNKQLEDQRRISSQSKSQESNNHAKMMEGTVEKLLDHGTESSETYQAVIKATSSEPHLVKGSKSNDVNTATGNKQLEGQKNVSKTIKGDAENINLDTSLESRGTHHSDETNNATRKQKITKSGTSSHPYDAKGSSSHPYDAKAGFTDGINAGAQKKQRKQQRASNVSRANSELSENDFDLELGIAISKSLANPGDQSLQQIGNATRQDAHQGDYRSTCRSAEREDGMTQLRSNSLDSSMTNLHAKSEPTGSTTPANNKGVIRMHRRRSDQDMRNLPLVNDKNNVVPPGEASASQRPSYNSSHAQSTENYDQKLKFDIASRRLPSNPIVDKATPNPRRKSRSVSRRRLTRRRTETDEIYHARDRSNPHHRQVPSPMQNRDTSDRRRARSWDSSIQGSQKAGSLPGEVLDDDVLSLDGLLPRDEEENGGEDFMMQMFKDILGEEAANDYNEDCLKGDTTTFAPKRARKSTQTKEINADLLALAEKERFSSPNNTMKKSDHDNRKLRETEKLMQIASSFKDRLTIHTADSFHSEGDGNEPIFSEVKKSKSEDNFMWLSTGNQQCESGDGKAEKHQPKRKSESNVAAPKTTLRQRKSDAAKEIHIDARVDKGSAPQKRKSKSVIDHKKRYSEATTEDILDLATLEESKRSGSQSSSDGRQKSEGKAVSEERKTRKSRLLPCFLRMSAMCLCYCGSLLVVLVVGFEVGKRFAFNEDKAMPSTPNVNTTSFGQNQTDEGVQAMTPSHDSKFDASIGNGGGRGDEGTPTTELLPQAPLYTSYLPSSRPSESPSTSSESPSTSKAPTGKLSWQPSSSALPSSTAQPSTLPSTTLPPTESPSYVPTSNPTSSPTLLPSESPSNVPSSSPSSIPGCPEELLKTIPLNGYDGLLTMRYEVVIHPGYVDRGGGLLCLSLEYEGEAGWIGIALSKASRDPQFGRKEAIIGLPGIMSSVAVANEETGVPELGQQNAALANGPVFVNPGKYELPPGGIVKGYNGPSLSLMSDVQKQTLIDSSVSVSDPSLTGGIVTPNRGLVTQMSFTKYLEEPGEIEIDPFKPTLFLYTVSPLNSENDDEDSGYDGNPEWKHMFLTLLDGGSSSVVTEKVSRERTRQHHDHYGYQ